MPAMRILLKKTSDGPPVLTCRRADGSATWARVHASFPMHDMTHYAVETTLAFREAFFGLVARGWTLDDFEAPGASDRMPPEAIWAEHIVGLLDQERATGNIWTAGEFNEALGLSFVNRPAFRPITDDELATIRGLRSELTRRWAEVPDGGTLELDFP